ncbi:MAG TPA: hypothetical protein VGQ53_08000 [Chitinophagaceae bacterium]|jgi:hypothetical protein|nr:hypothetical protein [Chitinophagaceae bacterium]
MKNILGSFFILISSVTLHAQYYYKDIIGTRDINQTIKLYLGNKVLSAEATGFDGDGAKNSDFSETHYFFIDRNLLKIATRNKTVITNEYYRFDAKGLLINLTDTSSSLESGDTHTYLVATTTYSYNDKDNPVLIKNTVTDASDSIYATEGHQWFYNDQGKPARMLKILNNNDTTEIQFTLDNKGNVIEEFPVIKKISGEKTYYYYDDKNRLTDIVRFNTKARRLLPDYMFEYTENNQVSQKVTTVSMMDLGYLIWRYVYDNKGLKTKEASFNRDKVMTGKIEYSYQFGQ